MEKRTITSVHVEYIKLHLVKRGRLTPEILLRDAKRKASPLHDLFDWDEKKAAEAFWLERSRDIIRSVRVVITTTVATVRVPAYIRDPNVPSDIQGYVSTETLATLPKEARRALLIECERAATSLKRARTVALALGLADEIDGILEHLTGFRIRIEHDEAA